MAFFQRFFFLLPDHFPAACRRVPLVFAASFQGDPSLIEQGALIVYTAAFADGQFSFLPDGQGAALQRQGGPILHAEDTIHGSVLDQGDRGGTGNRCGPYQRDTDMACAIKGKTDAAEATKKTDPSVSV